MVVEVVYDNTVLRYSIFLFKDVGLATSVNRGLQNMESIITYLYICTLTVRFQVFEIVQAAGTDLHHRTSASGTLCFQSTPAGIHHDYS